MKGNQFHYAWVVCGCCTIMLICTMGFTNNVFPVYIPFLKMAGLSGTQTSSLLSIRCVFSILAMLFVDKFYDFFGLRKGLTITCAISMGGLLLYSVSRQMFMYSVAAAVLGVAYGFGSMIPVGILMANWFNKRRSTAVGICAGGTGLGLIVFPPLITRVIQLSGTTAAFRMQAAFVLIVGIFVWLFIRETPSEMGIEPFGGVSEQAAAVKPGDTGYVLPGAKIALVAWFCIGAVSSGAAGHFSAHMTTEGIDPLTAGFAVSVFGVFLTLGKLLCGVHYDKFGCLKASYIYGALSLIGCLIFGAVHSSRFILVFPAMLVQGVGFSMFMVAMPAYSADFGTGSFYRKVLKHNQILYSIGGVFFSVIPGMVFDATGHYIAAYAAMAGLLGIMLVTTTIAYSQRKASLKVAENG